MNDIGEPLTSNVPDSYRTGVELMAGIKIAKWLTWSGNVTLSSNKIKNFTESVDNWDDEDNQVVNYLGTTDISYSPNITAGSLFTFTYKNWTAGLQTAYVGEQFVDNTSSDDRKLDDYTFTNLHLGYSLKLKGIKSIDFNVAVNNIFNAEYSSNAWVYSGYTGGVRYDEMGYFPQAGINVLGGVTLRF